MNRRSLTFRLTFLFALASAALLLGLGYLINSSIEHHFEALDLEELIGKLELAQHALGKVRSPMDMDVLPQQLDAALVGHPNLVLAVRWPKGKTLFATSGGDIPESLLERASLESDARSRLWKNWEGKPFRGISATVPLGLADAPPAIVAVAVDVSHHQRFLATFQQALWIIVVLAAVLNGFLARMAVRHGLAPLRAIKQTASGINANRLDYRLAEESVPVELKALVQTLNTMLGRLEESFQRLSDFSSDLAHELRTPVGNMLMQTQVILSRARTADEYKETLYSNAEEFVRLSRMISDMLFLAKADHGLAPAFKEVVDLAQEVNDLFSFFEVLADGKDVHLRLDGEGSVLGDRMLLRRAISNILSNAIRHTPQSGKVRVAIESVPGGGDLLLVIENTGEPIASEYLSRLFDRFYRVDASRHGSSEGAGLGLAIAKSIITLHGGAIAVQSAGGITRFEIRLSRDENLGSWSTPNVAFANLATPLA